MLFDVEKNIFLNIKREREKNSEKYIHWGKQKPHKNGKYDRVAIRLRALIY